MRNVVLYKSSTGYTKSYAEMLGKKLTCEVFSLDQVGRIHLEDYDTIIFGGGVRASKINGIKKLFQQLKPLKARHVVIFAVGGNEKSDENTKKLIDMNLKSSDTSYPLFYMQGGFDPERLGFGMKIILKNVGKSIQKKKEKDPASLSKDDQDFLNFFQGSHSEVSQENLNEILNYINHLEDVEQHT